MPQPHRNVTPAPEPNDPLILAAVQRAALHRARETGEVPLRAVLEHLALPSRGRASRHVRERLQALCGEGALEHSRRRGIELWALTAKGARRLQWEQAGAAAPALPESPQHARWRNSSALAAQEIGRFRERLHDDLADAARLLEHDPAGDSDAWFEIGQRLEWSCWLIGSASHVLYEWAEPSDAAPDIDHREDPRDERLEADELARRRARRTGRRNILRWPARR